VFVQKGEEDDDGNHHEDAQQNVSDVESTTTELGVTAQMEKEADR